MVEDQPVGDEGHKVSQQLATNPPQLPSPLLELAAELRLKILKYALPVAGQEHKVCELPEDAAPVEQDTHTKCVQYCQKHCPGILTVNHQIYNECLEFVREIKGFNFCSLPCMQIFLKNFNKEHMQAISRLSCQRIVTSILSQEEGVAELRIIFDLPSEGPCLPGDFLDEVKSFISIYAENSTWEYRLAIAMTSSSASARWTLSFSKTPQSDTKQHGTVQADHLILAAEETDIASIPVDMKFHFLIASGMIHLHLLLQCELAGLANGVTPPKIREIMPPYLQEYLLI